MRRLSARRLAALGPRLALGLFCVAGCGLFKASAPACIGDGGKACTEPFCGLVRSACEKQARVCQRPAGECDIEVCAQSAASALRVADEPATAARQLFGCVSRKTSCDPVDDCFATLAAKQACAAGEATLHTAIEPLLATRVPSAQGRGPAGVVVLPGDDLACLRCAFEPNGCAQAQPDCFSAAALDAGATDTCLDYRVCLRTCEQTVGDDALRYSQCAAVACDVPEHQRGKTSFAAYRQCMFDRCASCFGP
jgi:hypothetical protein